MKVISKFLIRVFIKRHNKMSRADLRKRYGLIAGAGSIIINVLLFIIKLGLGLLINSLALIADSVHTLSDSGTSIIVLLGFKYGSKPADEKHPFGHGRIEEIGALIISVLLIVTGVEFIRYGFEKFISKTTVDFQIGVCIVVIITIIVKELMARVSIDFGKRINSQALIADGIHHRSDAFTTIGVVASMIGMRLGILWLDGLVALLMGVFIIFSGIHILRNSASNLLGSAPSEEMINNIRKAVLEEKEVIGVHDIILHTYGVSIWGSLDIEVNNKLSIGHAHSITDKVHNRLVESLRVYVSVHVDPIDTENPEIDKMKKKLKRYINKNNEIVSYHDFRINKKKKQVFFDLAVIKSLNFAQRDDLKVKLEKDFKKIFSPNTVVFNLDKQFEN